MLSGEVGGRRHGLVVVAALSALAWALAAAPMAGAYIVDSPADDTDAVIGNELCETAAEECTLRAAIEEANSLAESATINFDEETFEDQATATIELGESLPTLTVPAVIEGRACEVGPGVGRPCVGIAGPSGEAALTVAGAEVEISGLAITGAQTAIGLEESLRSKVRGNWFGVAVDGSIVGNETGVLVDSESNDTFIGGEGPEHGNVFADSAGNALEIHASRGVRVLGNYFGVEPDGVTPAENGGDAVEVTATKVPIGDGTEFDLVEASGTEIGTRVSAAAAASPLCDRGCNVISGAGAHGVDLQGDGGLEAPAASTSIAGNYIGLNAPGTAAVPNSEAGVRVGEAAHTAIGGPSGGEANRLTGGSVGVLAGPAAGDLAVRGNSIGTGVTGEILAPPDDGIVVDSAELPSASLEAEIAGNEIGMEGGVGIHQLGEGAWIFANEVVGSQVGIRTSESTAHGNVIEANLIETPASNGILVETNFNEIVGNGVFGAGAAGVRIQGVPPFGVSANLIGGDRPEDENVIDASAGAAIEISNVEKTDNEVARNRGIGNFGLFIDLVAVSPGTEKAWPNRGIEPPTFSASTVTGASGGAEDGATVRVFRKQGAAPGEIESFLGEAVANDDGLWQLAYDAAIPAGTMIAAAQTKEGSTSELAFAATPGSGGADGGGAGAGGAIGGGAGSPSGSDSVRIRPQTRIIRGKTRRRAVRFVFQSDQPGSRFLCKIDGKPFDLCKSPKRYVGLVPGKHVFWVRAVDSAGRVDLSPAKKKFVVPG